MSAQLFGKTESEIEAAEMLRCRQITSEIVNFGVSQREMLRIIGLLALELEDRSVMVAVSDAVKPAITGSSASLGGVILET